uniref:Neurobeachin alpha-solenoid region domain-containing protein n=1 Tax=Aegilops tauschii subsp. strangulata TaxID=200361 RepID=A0A453SWI8_AEGTS
IECLFNLFEEESLRKLVLEQVLALFRVKLCFISNFPLLILL